MMLDFNAIKERLINEDGFSKREAECAIGDLQNLKDGLKPLLLAWVEEREVPDYEQHGFSYSGLITKYKMHPVAAILTMDWIVSEPDIAIPAIKNGIK